MDRRTRTLVGVNVDDILAAFGWGPGHPVRGLVSRLARGPAVRFAREMTAFDDRVARDGIREAARAMREGLVGTLRVSGLQRIPPSGPVLLLSNHPGMSDTVVLLSCIPRGDIMVLALDRPFLRALTAASRYLIPLPDTTGGRVSAMRRAVSHLKAGGALLTFPAGEIEPDPGLRTDAAEALASWSPSVMTFVRQVPACAVVPLVVAGVLDWRAQRSPFVLLRRRRADRERLAAMLQVLVHTWFPGAWKTRASLDVMEPLAGRSLAESPGRGMEILTGAVARHLLHRGRGGPGGPRPGDRR